MREGAITIMGYDDVERTFTEGRYLEFWAHMRKAGDAYFMGEPEPFEAFKRVTGNRCTPAGLLYMWAENPTGSGTPTAARAFLVPAARRPRRKTAEVLSEAAGFPYCVADDIERKEAAGTLREADARVMAWAAAYRGRRTPWLWIGGGTGAGKTLTAGLAARAVAWRVDDGEVPECSILYTLVNDLCGDIDAGLYYASKDRDTKQERMRRYTSCGLLVLDDLGSERPTASSFETVYRIIEKRHSERLPTIITTQYGFSEWAARYRGKADGHNVAALVSRLRQALGGYHEDGEELRAEEARSVVMLNGEDMRQG